MTRSRLAGLMAAAMALNLWLVDGASAQYGAGHRPPPRGYYHHGRRYHYNNNSGAVVAAGVFGLMAGAAIASANANRYDPPPAPIPYAQVDPYTQPYAGQGDFHAYCASKYSTYDPRDGTYFASDGRRYPCH